MQRVKTIRGSLGESGRSTRSRSGSLRSVPVAIDQLKNDVSVDPPAAGTWGGRHTLTGAWR
jgi:hypothetical protein